MDEAEHQYLSGQLRPGFPALLADFEARSAEAATAANAELDLRYGPAPRQTWDWFPAPAPARGTLLYWHAGYWHSRDKSGFRFLAPAFNADGLNVALANYPLCPQVTLAELIQACRAAPGAVAARATASSGAENLPLIVAGHSAGGHIAVELALGDAGPAGVDAADSTAPRSPITAVAALSGLYDLAPLLATSLNDKLRLDRASAQAASPLQRVAAHAVPALLAVGADETPAFIEQSRRMQAAWQRAGNRSALQVVAGCDHFSLLEHLAQRGSALHEAVVAFAD